MTTTRDELRFDAEAHLKYGGGGDELANGVLALLDALTRAEARADIRGRAVIMYRERAREAEARIRAVEDVLDQAWEEFDNVDAADIRRALEG